jgi:hypothetical protein
MPRSANGWWKEWFYLRNVTATPLPVLTGNRPVHQPNWGHRVARKDPGKLQPLSEVIQHLRQEGLIGTHLLRTFFGHRILPLWQQVTKIWLYPRPSYPDRSFSEEFSETEVNTQIHKVLDHGADLNPRAGPAPLREGATSTRVSLFRSIFCITRNFSPLIALVSLCRVSSILVARHGVSTCSRMR